MILLEETKNFGSNFNKKKVSKKYPIQWEMVVFGGSAAVSSHFHIVHTYGSHHTKGEPLNSLMKAAVHI